jgi:hypothetical protein
MPAGNGFDKFIVHADRKYPTSSLHQSPISVFSLVEAEIFNSQLNETFTTVVRVLAILRFRTLLELGNLPVDDKKSDANPYDDILCVVAPMEIDATNTNRSFLPYDLYQYQKDPQVSDNRMFYIACCHVSSILRPVFCMARNPTRIDNYANNTEFGRSNVRRQQFYVITVERWHPKVEQGRVYETFYLKKKSRNNKSWLAFKTESEILEFRPSHTE